jgi:hypothetical protein
MPSADVIPISPGFIKAHSPLPPVNAYVQNYRVSPLITSSITNWIGDSQLTIEFLGHYKPR